MSKTANTIESFVLFESPLCMINENTFFVKITDKGWEFDFVLLVATTWQHLWFDFLI